jgi:hypothetical protein
MKHALRTATTLSLALVAALALLAPLAAHAQINYQGRLTDSQGAALPDGQYEIQFSLWTSATGGASPVWGPYVLDGATTTGHGPLADLVGSRFNVIIGGQDTTSRSLTTSMAASTTVYLEIKVGTAAPISPRQIILAAPRALSADVIPFVTPNGSGVDISGNLSVSGDATTVGNAAVLGNATVTGNVGIGTLTPSAKLHVNGTAIVSGVMAGGNVTVGGKGVAVGEENLRIVRGTVAANGSTTAGSGFVATGPDPITGIYTITFNPAFTGIPSVTANGLGVVNAVATISAVTTSSCKVRLYIPTVGNKIDPFSFIAIGPR